MSSDAENNRQPSRPDTAVLHLVKLAPGAAHEPASDDGVTAFTARAAAETVEQSSHPVVVPGPAASVTPESMLGVVSYCYSKGVYGSEDIGKKMSQDPAFRASCHDQVPHPEDIRQFRRLNREAIRITLEKVLRFARKKVVEAWSPSNPFRDGAKPVASPAANVVALEGRREETQAFVRREAAERIDKATFIDRMSM